MRVWEQQNLHKPTVFSLQLWMAQHWTFLGVKDRCLAVPERCLRSAGLGGRVLGGYVGSGVRQAKFESGFCCL